jgi:quercetin 2,3-dioxygenase
MITIRPADARGHADYGWLNSYHTFSFADYYDPQQMGFRSLRVINQDRVAGGHGFPMHPHREMEIISYVLEGQLEHRDTMGSHSTIGPGEAQVISGGTGMAHSEYNPDKVNPVHFLQVWIVPDERQHGQPPVYAEGRFAPQERQGKLRLIASGDGRDGSVRIRQDADLYAVRLAPGDTVSHALRPDGGAWVHVATGSVALNGQTLNAGDGAAVSAEASITLVGNAAAEALVFDLA